MIAVYVVYPVSSANIDAESRRKELERPQKKTAHSNDKNEVTQALDTTKNENNISRDHSQLQLSFSFDNNHIPIHCRLAITSY